MGGYRRWFRLRLGKGKDIARELDDEIRTHLEMRVEELIAAGATPDEARQEARRRFGDTPETRERLYAGAKRSARQLRMHDRWGDLARDLKYAIRQARLAPGFTAVAVATIALGVGLSTATFTLVDHILLRALPFPLPQQLVSLQSMRDNGFSFNLTSMANWVDWRENHTTLAATAAFQASVGQGTVEAGASAISVPTRMVTGQFFETVLPTMAHGRAFTEAEAQEDALVAVVSEGFWRTVLGSGPDLEQLDLTVNGRPRRVVGVVRTGQEFPGSTQIWLPTRDRPGSGAMRNNINWSAIGRLMPGVTEAQAQADLSAIARGIMARDPAAVYSHGVAVKPLAEVVVGGARARLRLLMGAALFVLLVACANVAGLSLARARRREQEVAVRLALGAGRTRVLRQVIIEHVLLALAGGAVGVLAAWWTTGFVIGSLGTTLPRMQEVSFDGRVAAFGLLAALASGILAGALPAWRASGGTPARLISGARGSILGGKGLPGAVLVAGEIALAVLLVTGGALLVRSFQSLVGRDLGYEPRGVITAAIRLSSPAYQEPGRTLTYWNVLLDDLAAAPGVAFAGVANWIPTGGGGAGWIELAEQPDREASAGYRIASADYFEVLGIPVIEGRAFGNLDVTGGNRTVVINQRMAEVYWPGESPLGKRIRAISMEEVYHRTAGLEPWLTVVGVVGNVRHDGFEDDASSEMYVLYRQIPQRLTAMTAVVRTSGPDAATLAATLRERAQALDPSIAVEPETLASRLSGVLAMRRLFMTVIGTFALLALGLACLGVYGLLSFMVSERTREFAVRAALGARRGTIVQLTVRRALPILIGGTVVGLAAAYWLSGLLKAQLVEVAPSDPVTYGAAAALLGMVAVVAALVPAWRAARLDPLEALREG